jgi:predicted nicotinamide N-methyase
LHHRKAEGELYKDPVQNTKVVFPSTQQIYLTQPHMDPPGHEGAKDLVALRRRADGRTAWVLHELVDASELGLRITPIAGKGLGVVAERQFASGERVLAEAPLFAWASTANSSGAHDWEALQCRVDELDDESWRDFTALCDKLQARSKDARSIWNSNSFPMEDVMADGHAAARDGVVRSGVYRICSRINHACRPNCFAAWSTALGRQTVHALRNIARGEELSVAYVGGAEAGPRACRQRLLSDKYHFACTCAACSLTGDALQQSEERQRRIHEIHGLLLRSPSDLAALVREHVSLMRAEGLPPVWGKAGIILAIVQLKTDGDIAAAGEMAATGADIAKRALGTDSSSYVRFAALAKAFAAAVPTAQPDAERAQTAPPRSGRQRSRDTFARAAAVADRSVASAARGDTAAVADPSDGSVDDNEAPRVATYEVGEGEQSYERAPAEGWCEAVSGPRDLRFGLLSHRQRYAHRIWPAAQVLARHLDAHPEEVAGRAVLEIGAGAALPSVVAALLGARAVLVTDYPDERMLHNMRRNVQHNVPPAAAARTSVVGYDWKTSPSALLERLAELSPCADGHGRTAGGGGAFELILLADLLYECEHEPILRAVAACLAADGTAGADACAASGGGSDGAAAAPRARALLTFQVHDHCQLARQMAFFELAPGFGLAGRRMSTVTVGRQFENDDEEEPTEEGEDDVTAQVQMWELGLAKPAAVGKGGGGGDGGGGGGGGGGGKKKTKGGARAAG